MAHSIQPIPQMRESASPSRRYFKLQVRAWTDFDPANSDLTEIAQAIEQGHGFLSVLEVTRVAENVAEVEDPEIRQRFETVIALEAMLDKIAELPKPLKDKLYAVLVDDQQHEQGLNGTDSSSARRFP